MNLASLSDDELLKNTEQLAKKERELLISILYHLREIERRRLFSQQKLPSLFAYAVKTLGYSEDQASRRISAMRLLKELPQIEKGITDGDLNLTHLGMAQSVFSREKKVGRGFSPEKKLEVLNQISGLSIRQAEQVIFSVAPQALTPDRVKTVSEDFTELRFHVPTSLLSQIEELKGRLAHSHPNLSLGELMTVLCELGLKATEPGKSPAAPRVISQAENKRRVWRRDQNKCSHCGSTFALQIDHIHPRAAGGSSTAENLRVLCRNCNQRAAIEFYGDKKMDPYLTSDFSQRFFASDD